MSREIFKEPEPSYCFNAAEPVTFWIDNTHDEHKFFRGELCQFEHEWEKEELIFEENNNSHGQTFNLNEIEKAINGIVDEPKLEEVRRKLRAKKR